MFVQDPGKVRINDFVQIVRGFNIELFRVIEINSNGIIISPLNNPNMKHGLIFNPDHPQFKWRIMHAENLDYYVEFYPFEEVPQQYYDLVEIFSNIPTLSFPDHRQASRQAFNFWMKMKGEKNISRMYSKIMSNFRYYPPWNSMLKEFVNILMSISDFNEMVDHGLRDSKDLENVRLDVASNNLDYFHPEWIQFLDDNGYSV